MAEQTDSGRYVGYGAPIPLVLGVIAPVVLTGGTNIIALLIGLVSLVGAGYLIHPKYEKGQTAVSAGVVVGFFAGGFAFWYPMWQNIAYALTFANPGGLQWLAVGLIGAVVIALLKPLVRTDDSGYGSPDENLTRWAYVSLAFVGLAVVGFMLLGPMVSGMYAHADMANQVQMEAETIEELPDSDTSQTRIVPEGVARNWGENSLQYPQYRLAGGDITYINETPHWSYALSPDGGVNQFTLQQRGAVYVNQSSFSKDITVQDEQRFTYGQGVLLTDSYSWQMKSQDYTKDYQDPFVVPHEGESYLAVPYVTHSWDFRFSPLPQAYAVPEFGGVKLIDQDGNIEDLSPEEAQNSEVLGETQNYYPYSVASFKVESMAYKNGILNTIIGHEGQIEVAPVPGDGNDQPFTVPTEDEGIQYFVAAEPWGDANGIYEVYTVDAQTGDVKVQKLDQQSSLRGPRKAVDSVMAHPEISRLNDVKAVEPIPVVVNDDLYWQVRVIPQSSARITYVAYFNAGTEETAVVESTGEVNAFLADQNVPDSVDTGNETDASDSSSECDFTIVVEYPDGTSETVCVPDGGTVTVSGNSTASS